MVVREPLYIALSWRIVIETRDRRWQALPDRVGNRP
jgi:hypothetical protein